MKFSWRAVRRDSRKAVLNARWSCVKVIPAAIPSRKHGAHNRALSSSCVIVIGLSWLGLQSAVSLHPLREFHPSNFTFEATMTQRHGPDFLLKETKKNLYLFYFSSLFFHRYFPRDINYFILCLRFFSNSRAQFEGTVYATFNFFHRLTFTRPSFGLGRGRVIINVQVELGQANNLRVKGTGGDRERR